METQLILLRLSDPEGKFLFMFRVRAGEHLLAKGEKSHPVVSIVACTGRNSFF